METPMSIDANVFRQLMSRFASGVTVVTTTLAGERHGLTVSSFASLSLNPPLVLVCLDLRTPICDHIRAAGVFGLSILAADQELLSRHFASAQRGDWSGISCQDGVLGVPLLSGALATMECRLAQALPGGDHVIIVGEIEHGAAAEGAPLLYFRSGYHVLNGP
jgi:flavin reductase (DIM6/NTAB) family NADH-FMN oxidoreductase RutF